MKNIMFTHGNALRFFSHNKDTTIRARGRSGEPRHCPGDCVSLRIWVGKPYRSKTLEFARAVVNVVNQFSMSGDQCEIDGNSLDENQRRWLAKRDGFDLWCELRDALRNHHGDVINGYRYCFIEIKLIFNPNWLRNLQ